MFDTIFNLFLVLLAFGFVIFWHELGHFLAARWAGVRVEQFAVGMGQAVVSWRKGIGFRTARFSGGKFKWGSTQEEFEKRVQEEYKRREWTGERALKSQSELSIREQYDIAKSIGIGETEYRLSWVPLGGYVKPTGQDDLRPAAEVGADDPHAFGAKPVGKRMVIISAGVIMNVILAFMLYVLLFLVIGFNSPPAIVGQVVPGSPAQKAGVQVGDKLEAIDGYAQADWTKINMNVALLRDDEPATFTVIRAGSSQPVELKITPVKTRVSYNMPSIGVGGPGKLVVGAEREQQLIGAENEALPVDTRITSINDAPVDVNDVLALDQALQASEGKSVRLGVELPDKTTRIVSLAPRLALAGFNDSTLSIAGMRPRVQITGVIADSPAHKAGLKAGDVIQQLAISDTADVLNPPSQTRLRDWINRAGAAGKDMRITVIRDGAALPPIPIVATASPERGKKGIGVGLDYESADPVIGEVVDNSPARSVGLHAGDRVTAIDGSAVDSWYQVLASLRQKGAGDVKLTVATATGTRDVTMQLGDYADQLHQIRYAHTLLLAQRTEERKTSNPLTAMKWGVEETKYSIFQVYQTLQRLFQGTVPASNLSGPLGIFAAGASAADRGMDWLVWFTALISANLAVVNFLPIPIVDGGLFLFLLAEKITGKPPSPRVQTVAQVIGLVLLGGLFLFVTYHDILRTFG